MDFPFAKFTNKFHNFQTISQHLDNKQDVNILKHTYIYLTFMNSIKTYETGQDLIQKIITCIFSIMFQRLWHNIYSIEYVPQHCKDNDFYKVHNPRTKQRWFTISYFKRCSEILISTKFVVQGPDLT